MKSFKKIFFYGIIIWLVPFLISFPFYSKQGQPLIDIFLIKTIMIIIGSLTGVICLTLYFKNLKENFLNESIFVGFSWLFLNWMLDIIFLIPMGTLSVETYFTQIGLRYLTIPIVSIGFGKILQNKTPKKKKRK